MKWQGLFCNGAIIGTFAAHLTAGQGEKMVLELEVEGVQPTFPHYDALALWGWSKLIYLIQSLLILECCFLQVQHALLLFVTETITLKMIHNTGKPSSPLPQTLNNSMDKFSAQGTGFNESSWGEQTHGLIKLIVYRIQQVSYDKVIAAVKEIIKKTHGSTHTEEVIDLTTDESPE